MDTNGSIVMCQATMKNGTACVHKARRGEIYCGSHLTQFKNQEMAMELASSVAVGRHEAMPDRLLKIYNFSKEDEEQLALKSEMALTDTRINDLLTRVDSGESGKTWKLLKEAWREYKEALRANDQDLIGTYRRQIGDLITQGNFDALAWSEIRELMETRRRLADTDRRRMVEMSNIVSQEDGLALITRLYEAVMLHVPDPSTRAAIARSMGPLSPEVVQALAS